MSERSEPPKKLVLKWDICCFLPNLESKENRIIRESLDPAAFESDKEIEQYWSVPERLVDIRWVLDRIAAKKNSSNQQNIIDEYIRLEHCLYRTVITLGQWAWTCTKCIKQLNENPSTEHELQKLWDHNGNFFKECISASSGEPLRLSEDQLIKIYQFSKKLSAKTVADTRKKDIDTVANHFAKRIERTWGADAEKNISLLLISSSEQQEIFQLAKEFIEKTVDYFNNPLWRKDEQAVEKLKELIRRIKKVLPEWNPEGTEEWSLEYTESIWQGLQEFADSICEKINTGIRKGTPFVTEMRQRVTKVMEILGLRGNAKKELKKYSNDHGRCVALMELDNNTRLMAFSGYWDCEDVQARQALQLSYAPDILGAFRLVSASFGANLAAFSKDVVDRIVRYEPESGCTLRQCGPLRQELRLSSTEHGLSFIKKSYSCCERKILAAFEAMANEEPKTATLYVKFPPCLSCFGALQSWAKRGNIQFVLDYPKGY